jgi:hypothetical protein
VRDFRACDGARNFALNVGSDSTGATALRTPSMRRTVTLVSPLRTHSVTGTWRNWHAFSQGHIAAGRVVRESGTLRAFLRRTRLRMLLLRIALGRSAALGQIQQAVRNQAR